MLTTAKIALDPLHPVETAGGVAVWRHLSWDTEQFGFPAARIEQLEAPGPYSESCRLKNELLASVVEQCRVSRIRHLSARVGADDISSIHALERTGFELMDGAQIFEMNLRDRPAEPSRVGRLFRYQDLPALLEIGRTAFLYDRFHADSSLPPGVADRLHEAWTRNCCLGPAADAVFVSEDQGRVAGFVACRAGRESSPCVIVLVATAEWARGKGLARQLTLSALNWFEQRRTGVVEVGTQLRNIPAARLYLACGFRPARIAFTFRRIL